jgi:hypothetical protein
MKDNVTLNLGMAVVKMYTFGIWVFVHQGGDCTRNALAKVLAEILVEAEGVAEFRGSVTRS